MAATLPNAFQRLDFTGILETPPELKDIMFETSESLETLKILEVPERPHNQGSSSIPTKNTNRLPKQRLVSVKPIASTFDATLKLLKEMNVEPENVYGHTIIDKNKKQTLLHYVTEKGNAEVLNELLQEKCDLTCRTNLPGSAGCTPLHLAAWRGNDECLKLLIEAGSDVNSTDEDLWTPLHYAALHNHFYCLKTLISHGANINAKDKWNMTPLHSATFGGQLNGLKELILHGADLNAQDNFGNAPLHLAASCGKLNCLKGLIDAGANPQLKNKDGETALEEAIINNQPKCAEYLAAPRASKTCRIS